jgi:hypothetical protein
MVKSLLPRRGKEYRPVPVLGLKLRGCCKGLDLEGT